MGKRIRPFGREERAIAALLETDPDLGPEGIGRVIELTRMSRNDRAQQAEFAAPQASDPHACERPSVRDPVDPIGSLKKGTWRGIPGGASPGVQVSGKPDSPIKAFMRERETREDLREVRDALREFMRGMSAHARKRLKRALRAK